MNQEEHTQIQIEAYLNGELSDSEREEFERELDTNTELKEQFEELQSAYQLLRLYRRAQLKDQLNILSEKKPIYSQRPIYLKPWFLAAASFLILFSSVYIYSWQTYSNEAVLMQSFEPYSLGTTKIRGEESAEESSNFQQGIDQYSKGNYRRSISSFKKIPKEDSNYFNVQFYLGNAYMKTENPILAIQAFKSAEGIQEMEMNRRWYLSLAFLANDQLLDARNTLEDLAQNSPDQHYSKRAKCVLKQLDNPLRILPLIGN